MVVDFDGQLLHGVRAFQGPTQRAPGASTGGWGLGFRVQGSGFRAVPLVAGGGGIFKATLH